MTLLDRGLKAALFAGPMALFLAGCPGGSDTGKTDDSSDNGSGDNGSGDNGSGDNGSGDNGSGDNGSGDNGSGDNGSGNETGIVQMWIVGNVQTSGGSFSSGAVGVSMYDISYYPDLHSVCDVIGPAAEGAALPACEVCDWSFDLVVSGSTASGSDCSDFGVKDGWMDGYEGGFGWADTYDFEYGGTVYSLTDTVFYYFSSYGQWYFVGYNYGPYGYNSGDASDATFNLALNAYYYFYP